ncbi:hypothetical protein B0H21DRAFT_854140 [Amylocystis lapponica]|nr:hypothetical protein B0H21DRAFT_854140 [Amylocystis lapponica]
MNPRYPSSSSALTSCSSIRHRSGAYSPNPDQPTRAHGSSTSTPSRCHNQAVQIPTVQVEDADDTNGQPRILHVQPSRRSPPLPPLPSSAQSDAPHDTFFHLSHHPAREAPTAQELSDEYVDTTAFSPIPLTPRPPKTPRNQSARSVQTTRTTASQISRLPTPDFTTSAGGSFRSFLPRLFSVRGAHDAPALIRSSSFLSYASSDDSTAVSASSKSGARASSRLGRPPLPASLSTSDKFTHKFPRPRSIRNPTYGRTGLKAACVATMLEEGSGLGMERIDRWTPHKWCLLLSVCTVFVYGTAGLVCAILTWYRTWPQADVMIVADGDIVALIALAGTILLLTFLVGISGTLLNSRPLLATYALLLWPALLALLAVGYTAYRRAAFALDRKLSRAWSEWYTALGRRVLQDALRCCGLYSAAHDAAPSTQCYARAPLPGCMGRLLRVERAGLARVWAAAFALVPVHLANIGAALLCANHVTRTFGKGLVPRRYRLRGADVRADARRLADALGVRPVVRPGLARARTSEVFRADREDSVSFLDAWVDAAHGGTFGSETQTGRGAVAHHTATQHVVASVRQ